MQYYFSEGLFYFSKIYCMFMNTIIRLKNNYLIPAGIKNYSNTTNYYP